MAPAVVRVLVSHQCGLGSIPILCHMWVECWFSAKTSVSKSQSDHVRRPSLTDVALPLL